MGMASPGAAPPVNLTAMQEVLHCPWAMCWPQHPSCPHFSGVQKESSMPCRAWASSLSDRAAVRLCRLAVSRKSESEEEYSARKGGGWGGVGWGAMDPCIDGWLAELAKRARRSRAIPGLLSALHATGSPAWLRPRGRCRSFTAESGLLGTARRRTRCHAHQSRPGGPSQRRGRTRRQAARRARCHPACLLGTAARSAHAREENQEARQAREGRLGPAGAWPTDSQQPGCRVVLQAGSVPVATPATTQDCWSNHSLLSLVCQSAACGGHHLCCC